MERRIVIVILFLAVLLASPLANSNSLMIQEHLRDDPDSIHFSSGNGTSATSSFASSTTLLFSRISAGNIGANTSSFSDVFKGDTVPELQYKGITYILHIMQTTATDDCNRAQNFGATSYYGWTKSSTDDIVTAFIAEDYFQLWIRDFDEGRDIHVESWSDNFSTQMGIQGNTGDLLVYDTQDLLESQTDEIDWQPQIFPPRHSSLSTDGPLIPASGHSAYQVQNSFLYRVSLYRDSTISNDQLADYCAGLTELHGLWMTTLGVWLQLEFTEVIPATNAFGHGYKEWNTTQMCGGGGGLDNFSAYVQNDQFGEGANIQRNITQMDNSWLLWNRGQFVDSAIYVTDDPYWSWGGKGACTFGGYRHNNNIAELGRVTPIAISEDQISGLKGPYYNWVPRSLDIVMILGQELGHNLDLKHEDGFCNSASGGLNRHVSIMQWSYCWGIFTTMGYFSYSTDARFEAYNLSNDFSIPYIGLRRNSIIPAQGNQYSVDGLRLNAYFVDTVELPLGQTPCAANTTQTGVFYRTEYTVTNMNQINYSVMESFNAISSTYSRNLSGEWDYWQGYHRDGNYSNPLPAIILLPADTYTFNLPNANDGPANQSSNRFYGAGFIRDSTSSEICVAGSNNSPPANANSAYMDHHPNHGPGNPNQVWSFFPALNSGTDWHTNQSYLKFPSATISIYVF